MAFFLNSSVPILTAMLKSRAADRLIAEIERVRSEGAVAVGLQFEVLEDECKTISELRRVFSALDGLPIYFTNYKRGNTTEGVGWDGLTEWLFTAASLGASLIDIPADAYNSSDMELTSDPIAIAKQKRITADLHSLGTDVLMSSHVLRFAPKDTVLRIAEEHFSRGADISKIVTEANSDAELYENFEISAELAKRYGNRTLFLCNGTHARRHRLFAPPLGSAMFLAAENVLTGQMQPTLAEAVEIMKLSFGGK